MKLICIFVMLSVTMAQAKSFGADGAGQPATDDGDWFAQYMDEKDQEDIVEECDALDVDVDGVGNLKLGL